MNQIITETLKLAEGEIGVREVRENRGARVEEYLRSVGLPPGNPWCAAFCYWAVDQAAARLGVSNKLLKTGYCPYIAKWAEERALVREKPRRGDLFLRFGRTRQGVYRAHHTGFVLGSDGPDFATVEGNTNLAGSSEGIGVFRRGRTVGDEYRFVRWADLFDTPKLRPQVSLWLNGKPTQVSMTLDGGVAQVALRAFASLLGASISWDRDAQAVRWNGEVLPVQTSVVDGVAWASVRDVAETLGGRVTFDGEGQRVLVDVKGG